MSISIMVEIPEELHEALSAFLVDSPGWEQDRVIVAALSLFLMQHNGGDRKAAKAYLEAIFNQP